MSLPKSPPTRTSAINVTPYIDILLVLLIVFMVIQPEIQYDLETRVPQERPRDTALVPSTIVVSIEDDGSFRINQEMVPTTQLQNRLFSIFSMRSDKNMFVWANRNLPFGDVVRVIDIARGAGAGDIGLLAGD